MIQVPQTVWNQMVKTVLLKSDWAKVLFPATPEQVEKVLDDQYQKMTKAGFLHRVISSYQTVLPLLLERQAITQFIQKSRQFNLRQALPEVSSPQDAVALMTQDQRLNKKEAEQLLNLLLPHQVD